MPGLIHVFSEPWGCSRKNPDGGRKHNKEPSCRLFLPLRHQDTGTTGTAETRMEITSVNEESSLVVYSTTSSSTPPLHRSDTVQKACVPPLMLLGKIHTLTIITLASEGWECSTVEVSTGRQVFVTANGVLLHG